MPLSESLELLINADPSQGIAAMQNFATQADRSLSTVESRIARFSSSAMKVGAAGIGVGGLLTQMASGDIEAANQLTAAIEANGQAISDYQDRIDEAIDTQVKFGHTDEEVSNALTKLVSSYGDTGAALDKMQLAADLAAFRHIGLADAAGLVAKAHGGAGRLFKEFNIQVKESTDGTKDYDAALAELSGKLSGQASAAADSWGGKLRELSARAENFVSELGQNFGPAILGISTGMTALSGLTSLVSGALAKQSASHAAAAAAAEAQAIANAELAASEALVTTNSAASVASLYRVDAAASTTAGSTGKLSTSMAGLVSALGSVAIGAGIGAGLLAIFGDGTTDLDAKVKELASTADDELVPAFQRLDSFDQLNTLLTLTDSGEQGIGVLIRLRDAARAAGEDTARYDAAIAEATQRQQTMNASAETGANAIRGVGDAAAEEIDTKQQENLAKWFEAIAENADKANEAALKLAPADIRVQRGRLEIEEGKGEVAEAERKLDYLRKAGASTEDIAAAERDLASKRLDLQQATIDQAEALIELERTQDAANGQTKNADVYTQNQVTALGMLAAAYDGPVANALGGYIINAQIAIDKTAELERLQNILSGNAESLHVPQGGSEIGPRPSGGVPARRAGGGPVMAGEPYIVGEHRPELFVPNQSGYIHPSVPRGYDSPMTQSTYHRTVVNNFYGRTDPDEVHMQTTRALRVQAMLEGG